MHFLGASKEEAEQLLEQHGGVIRRVLDRAPPPVTST
jgi:N-acetylmuramic acid 6-phosphate (MurNAc-6-P) etherase